MTHREPVNTVNLDQYGNDALPWSGVLDALRRVYPDPPAPGQETFTVLGTVLPDGRPHAACVGAMWIDGAWYVVSGPGTRKSRNLAHNPACTLTAKLPGIDVVFVGDAYRVSDPNELERVAAVYRAAGWPAEVEGDAFTAPYTAPSGGPPPGISTGSPASRQLGWERLRALMARRCGSSTSATMGTSGERDGPTLSRQARGRPRQSGAQISILVGGDI